MHKIGLLSYMWWMGGRSMAETPNSNEASIGNGVIFRTNPQSVEVLKVMTQNLNDGYITQQQFDDNLVHWNAVDRANGYQLTETEYNSWVINQRLNLVRYVSTRHPSRYPNVSRDVDFTSQFPCAGIWYVVNSVITTPTYKRNSQRINGQWRTVGGIWRLPSTMSEADMKTFLMAKYQVQADKATIKLNAQLENFTQNQESCGELLTRESTNSFVLDIQSKAKKFLLSTAQVTALKNAFARDDARTQQRADETASLITPPSGKNVVVGVIISKKQVSSDYGMQTKILLMATNLEGSFKLWGTLPAKLITCEVGDKIKFTATVTPKEQGFGFYSRPSQPSKISPETEN